MHNVHNIPILHKVEVSGGREEKSTVCYGLRTIYLALAHPHCCCWWNILFFLVTLLLLPVEGEVWTVSFYKLQMIRVSVREQHSVLILRTFKQWRKLIDSWSSQVSGSKHSFSCRCISIDYFVRLSVNLYTYLQNILLKVRLGRFQPLTPKIESKILQNPFFFF